jgi:hypothetical protein
MDFDPSEWEVNYDAQPTGGDAEICYYGTGCKYQGTGCTRQHLPDNMTPCRFGPNCRTQGCEKIHATRFNEWCKYRKQGKGCTDIGCRYMH